MIDEYARHLDETRSPGIQNGIRTRSIIRYALTLTRALDLRDSKVCKEIAPDLEPADIVQDRAKARGTAAFARTIFIEKLQPDIHAFISDARIEGEFEMRG